jgi:hypothetical protein
MKQQKKNYEAAKVRNFCAKMRKNAIICGKIAEIGGRNRQDSNILFCDAV